MAKPSVRVGAAQGFYGDSLDAALATARRGDIDYLSFDALSELTLAILAKDRAKNPAAGYTKDFVPAMRQLLPLARQHGFKILTNAGGINPEAAQAAAVEVAAALGLSGLRIAVVTGDDVRGRLEEWARAGWLGGDLETGRNFGDIPPDILFANVYLGSEPLVAALAQGADLVISGRTTDSAQFMAPLLYEFGWAPDDWDRLAQGVLMGHLLECSAQSTGGNFSGAWWTVPDLDRVGYPVAVCRQDGSFVLTKTPGTGGLVSRDTVKEQMLYEIHDPARYLTPDVVADFTAARLHDAGPDQVEVSGAAGHVRPATLKLVVGYPDGYMGQALVGYAWPDALLKAEAAEAIVRRQLARRGWEYDEIHTDYLGWNSLHGPAAPRPPENINEIYLRMSVRARTAEQAARFGRLFPPLALDGPPGMGGTAGMMPPRQLLGMWSGLIARELVDPFVRVRIEEVD
ncbi:MAG: DUF1446 domain-containing protein [Thermaerobacter sp.]|nr:DUF1446 domain-containing protein [Thermaerobacter sp.]